MKKYYFFLIIFLFAISSCTDDEFTNAVEDSERIGIGAYSISEEAKAFVPYFSVSTLIMEDGDGNEIVFQGTSPATSLDQPFSRKFPHPNDFDRDVIYDFSGERIEFEFLNTNLGVKFEIILITDICSNPNLEKEGQVKEHLQIEVDGFRSPESKTPVPTLIDIVVEERNICKSDGVSGTFIPEVFLGNKTFFEVYRKEIPFEDSSVEVFYNAGFGIVGFKIDDISWTLKEIN